MRLIARLPDYATEFFKDWPWQQATFRSIVLKGLMFDGVYVFNDALGNQKAVVLTTDFNIDTDGPGGSTAIDKYWKAETSLRWPDGSSLDSRQFPGLVVPPVFTQFGVRKGDFGFSLWNDSVASFQVYDFGPIAKAGEGSVYLARALGVVPSTASDHRAATFGDNATDVVSVIFPATAPGIGESIENHAISPRLIHKTVRILLAQRNFPDVTIHDSRITS